MKRTLAALVVLLSSAAALADEPPPEHRWYGSRVIIADALSTSVAVAGVMMRSEVVAKVGVAGYLVAPPLIHAAHENGLEAVGSLAIRAALPIAGARVGLEMCNTGDGSTDDCTGHVMLGLVAGAGVAMILDAALLARGEVRPARRREASWAVSAGPRVDGGWTVALGGAF